MIRTLVTVSLVLISGRALTGKSEAQTKPVKAQATKGEVRTKPGKAEGAKNEAQIQSVKAQIEKAHHDEAAELKQIDEQTRTAVKGQEKPEQHEKQERARLEHEEKEALKHIDEHFEHVIHNLTPKGVHQELEATLKTLEHVRVSVMGHKDDLNFHGRVPVMNSVRDAKKLVNEALHNGKPEECKKAAEAVHAAFREVEHCLSINPVVNGPEKSTVVGAVELAATTRLLQEDLVKLDRAHHLLRAADHEIKDLEHEKKELLKKKEEEKQKAREEFKAKAEKLTKEIHQQQEKSKQLEQQREAKKKSVKEKYAGQIKGLEAQLKQLEKTK